LSRQREDGATTFAGLIEIFRDPEQGSDTLGILLYS